MEFIIWCTSPNTSSSLSASLVHSTISFVFFFFFVCFVLRFSLHVCAYSTHSPRGCNIFFLFLVVNDAPCTFLILFAGRCVVEIREQHSSRIDLIVPALEQCCICDATCVGACLVAYDP